jgi:uncharacterized Zn-finger protein
MHQPNSQTLVEVTRDELPVHCPTPDSSLWNSHPRVFIPLNESPEARCSYCGTVYRLVKEKSPAANTNVVDKTE